MFRTNNLRSALLVGAATAAALSLSGAALAAEAVETVVVTGTHIASPNLASTSPVVEATATDIQIQGVTKIEDLLNQMPQVFAAQNATVSNGSTGTATVNLRGLGCGRTLVLIDGRRMPFGTPLQGGICADLNQIPTQLVDRVEVLSGGSSAVYGSDAVAGVVNFIMKQDFEGVQFNMQLGTYEHGNDYTGPGNLRSVIQGRAATNPSQFKLPEDTVWDGFGKQLSGLMGVSSANGKGNITAYFSYRANDKISEANRDYSSCSIGGVAGSNFTCGGSGTSYPGQFTDFSTFAYTLDSATGNTFRDYNGSTDAYNYGPLNYYQRPDERYSLGAFGHYDLNDHFKFYTQLMFTDYTTVAQIAPSGDFGNVSTVNCGNPLMSASQAADIGCSPAMITANDPTTLYVLRRNVEGGGRQDDLRYQSYRALFGVRGSIDDAWSYDFNGAYARTELARTYQNDFSVTRLGRALDVVDVSGTPTCQSVVDGTDPRCVPYDVFSIGGVNQAALNYLQIPLVMTGASIQKSMSLLFTGDLGQYNIRSPFAKTGVQVALGAEYREDRLETMPDTSFQTQDGAGQGGATVPYSGATHVAEGYLETKIPIAEEMPFFQSSSLELAYRYSAYDHITTNTYKVGVDWAPVTSIRFRGSYDRAVRAPNVFELYQGQGYNLFDMDNDPCGPNHDINGHTTTLAECAMTPVLAGGAPASTWYGNAALDSPAQQYNFLQGGNQNLQAEKADTFTGGFVFTPESIPGLNVTVDYWDIKVHGLIGTVGASNIMYGCYALHNTQLCSAIHRNAAGLLWVANASGWVTDLNTNIGGIRTSGVDFSVLYQFDLADAGLQDAGVLGLSLQGTWLNKLTTDTGVGVTFACTGLFGTGSNCGVPNPAWRHVFRVNWEAPWYDLVVTGTWRFFGGVRQYAGSTTALDYRFPSESYFDMSAAVPVYDWASVRIGVNNLFDADPPLSHITGTTGNGNTYPQTYDAFGRYMFMSLTINL